MWKSSRVQGIDSGGYEQDGDVHADVSGEGSKQRRGFSSNRAMKGELSPLTPAISRLCTPCPGSLWGVGSWSTGAAVVVGTPPRPQRPVGGAEKRTRQRAR